MDRRLSTLYRRYQEDQHPVMNRLRDGDGARFVPGVGPVPARVMFLGEAPGTDEVARGEPFRGKAGEVLNEWLFIANLPRREVFITNAVKYRPVKSTGANRKPWKSDLEVSAKYFDFEVKIVRPQWIVALGATALEMLYLNCLMPAPKITDRHGTCWPWPSQPDIRIFALYHPAAVLHNDSLVVDGRRDATVMGNALRA